MIQERQLGITQARVDKEKQMLIRWILQWVYKSSLLLVESHKVLPKEWNI